MFRRREGELEAEQSYREGRVDTSQRTGTSPGHVTSSLRPVSKLWAEVVEKALTGVGAPPLAFDAI